ncbi:ROK family protein [Flavivirga spongiicola]|uniref:ROK family protein n=1 Tax=Flavivirga spongiicola TaxID=421621 RepID=A0ABU7XTR7_9FLAO|nr:ROK family protein [Flavivirga sp. MEBiC05379]MDO5978242.1 ROK family protein [Flavivirga sp. MEBiC05379]
MSNQIAIGVDVGGSHITSAAVDLKKLTIISETTFSVKVDNKAEKDIILRKWSDAINKTIVSASLMQSTNIGFAIPGPFNYKDGIALFKGENDKYENLYNVSISEELSKYLVSEETNFRFLNDATSFAVGVSAQGKAKNCNKIIAVTLGTGFGSAFIKEGIPLVNHPEVPKEGCLWDKPFKSGVGDDYFSTRWCIKRYDEISSKSVNGVKEIAKANTDNSRLLFEEFGHNMGHFMIPFIQKYEPQLIVVGGNISKASNLFIPTLNQVVKAAGLDVRIEISTLMEDAAIIGSAKLFNVEFWNKIKNDLPVN